jgi:hypothetical protein
VIVRSWAAPAATRRPAATPGRRPRPPWSARAVVARRRRDEHGGERRDHEDRAPVAERVRILWRDDPGLPIGGDLIGHVAALP